MGDPLTRRPDAGRREVFAPSGWLVPGARGAAAAPAAGRVDISLENTGLAMKYPG
jgi:hypothetical protein